MAEREGPAALRTALGFLLQALAVFLTGKIVPGITVSSYGAAIVAAVLLAIGNVFVRPILVLLTLPITCLTLGIFILLLNGVIFMVALNVVKGIEVDGFFTAILGWIVCSVLSGLIQGLVFGTTRQRDA